ncbi:MAG: LysR family transcriptional regulator [Rhodospirillum sp.]|nr:LysR family transcriptional regulator [Rhodospirillum sp.]MCF8489249.1 LysR family transcriptional regulator [Rhodospirillum sp.]MCF8502579.1 LysR family transcriptional regulator [Rhodospirillum sp.]
MKRARLPLNALRAFEAVGRLGRMTLAAEELHVTHGAISRQVRHLEEVLGVPLLEGPRNDWRLTEAGRALLPGLRTAFDGIEGAVAQVADTTTGPLDLSCIGTFAMRWLIPRLHRFQERHPEVEVRLASSDRPVDFSRDGFDLAIRVGRSPWPGGVVAHPLFPEYFGPVHAPGWSLSGGTLLRSHTRPGAWEDWCALSGDSPPDGSAVEYEHFFFMLEAATGGLGTAVGPWPHVVDDVLSGRLVAPRGFIPSGLDYVALVRPGKPRRRVALVLEWLVDEAARFVGDFPPPGVGA